MRIWHISDTHTKHKDLVIPDLDTIDLIVHSGDASHSKNIATNTIEMLQFIEWYDKLAKTLPCIFIPGNHETSIEAGAINRSDFGDIIYLENEIYTHKHKEEVYTIGAWSYTRKFYDWAFNVDAEKLCQAHYLLSGCDIVISHGPPYGYLDLIEEANGYIRIGCPHLLSIIPSVPYILCGHVHSNSNENIINTGIFQTADVIVSNAACINDANGQILYHGNKITIDASLIG